MSMTDRKPPAAHGNAPGTMAGEHTLAGAVEELHRQHPHPMTNAKGDDRGPYHRTDDHNRHKPVIGHRR